MAFKINSAPEHFQYWLSQILTDLEGSIYLIGDVLIFRKTQEEHDALLSKLLEKLQTVGLTLNHRKINVSFPNHKWSS